MSRYHSHLNTSLNILTAYDGSIPFNLFIKQFFSKEKKYGSKDRKQITSLCYSYFRLGLAFKKELTEENIIKAFFLTGHQDAALIHNLKPGWAFAGNATLDEKQRIANTDFSIEDIFPYTAELGESIHQQSFATSFLSQPHLFIRTRPQHQTAVIEKLTNTGIDFRVLDNGRSIQLPSGTNIEQLLEIDKEAVIQDHNSQQVFNYLQEKNQVPANNSISAWDCCAASGGKSILLHDITGGKTNLTVSDIRKSILHNLQQRFLRAGIKNYDHFVADISNTQEQLPSREYDIIICDAPCTGSGTWARTPEQLYYFDPAAIDVFAGRQEKIVQNIHPHLKKGGLLFYITCSVFKRENEEVTHYIQQHTGLQLIETKYLTGYDRGADTMFTAVFTNPAD